MLSEVSRDALLRFVQHLPTQTDLVLIVLKGHLLIEQQLHDIVRHRVADAGAIKTANLRFWQLARLAKSLVGADVPENWWNALDTLNALRNELAHKLDPASAEQLATKFLSQVQVPSFEGVLTSTVEDRLKAGMAYICGGLLHLTEPEPPTGAA